MQLGDKSIIGRVLVMKLRRQRAASLKRDCTCFKGEYLGPPHYYSSPYVNDGVVMHQTMKLLNSQTCNKSQQMK